MTSTELVGPLLTIRFRGGRRWDDPDPPKVVYTPPRDTCDPRYGACTEHHVACDCREAEWAETQHEWRAEAKDTQRAFDEILAGHLTRTYDDQGPGCMCTGCQIARAAHIYPHPPRTTTQEVPF